MKPCMFTQNNGYKHKRKSLEEILRATTKKESELIGYDEEPINVEDDVQMKNLLTNGEMEGNIFFQNEVSLNGRSETSIQSTAGNNKVDKNDANNGRSNKSNVVMQNCCLPRGATDKINQKEYHGMVVSKLHFFLCKICLSSKASNEACKVSTTDSNQPDEHVKLPLMTFVNLQ